MKLVLVDSYDSFTFNLLQMLGELAGERPIVVKNDEVGPAEIMAMAPAGVVLSPGPGHPLDAGRIVEIIRDLNPEIPLLGVCLGHQAIVEAEGGHVGGAAQIMHGKTSDVAHNGGVCFAGISSPFVAMRYHSLAADPKTLPATLRVNAHTADGTIMAVEHKTRPVFGVQFHPESIATGIGQKILANFVAFCGQRTGVSSRTADVLQESIGPILDLLMSRADLSRDMTRTIGERLLSGQLTQAQIGALAIALRAKGERADELAGFALALRAARQAVVPKRSFLEVAGTTRLAPRAFDVATAASLVIAAAGVPVARTAAGDTPGMLQTLGVQAATSAEAAARSVDELGFALVPPALAGFANVPQPREIGPRTIFDLVGPLIGSTGARRHFVGTFSEESREVVVRALKAVGAERALVVHGEDGSEFVSSAAPTRALELRADGSIIETRIDPAALGLTAPRPEDIRGGNPTRDAQFLLGILDGEAGHHRDLVAVNAAAGLMATGAAIGFEAALFKTFEAIDSGEARALLERLCAFARKGI